MTNYKDIKRIPIVAADVPNLAASKITSGTLDNARITLDAAEIPSLATSKITSGTFADARISASSVTAHVSATDLTPVRQDVLTLALKQAIQENSTKFNLPNSAITKFEADADFNLAGSTTATRHASEYIWASTAGYGASTKFTVTSSNFWSAGIGSSSSQYPDTYDGVAAWGVAFYNTDGSVSASNAKWIGVDLGSSQRIDYFRWYSKDDGTNGRIHSWGILKSAETDGSSRSLLTFDASGNGSTGSSVTSSEINNTDGWAVATPSATTDTRYIALTGGTIYNNGNVNSNVGEFEVYTLPYAQSTNATGTALGTTNVPTSAVTEVSGVMLLKNAYGTNTLGTDVKVYFTADNSNWTEVTSGDFTDAGTFSTGIKMIKMAKKTVTSGSDVRWKVVWANQSASSKEGHIYGIGLNY